MSARISEKVIQAQGIALLRSINGAVYSLGTVRRRGDHPGTMQSPGVPDVLFFLPPPPIWGSAIVGWWEAKARGGRMSPAQVTFRDHCLGVAMRHVVGDLDALIAFLKAERYLVDKTLPHYRAAIARESQVRP